MEALTALLMRLAIHAGLFAPPSGRCWSCGQTLVIMPSFFIGLCTGAAVGFLLMISLMPFFLR
jgi:hypothetical protein